MEYNIESNPEAFGMEILSRLEESGLSYEYNTLLVFRQKNSNEVYYAKDSGCSCPTPFENIERVSDLTPVTQGDSFQSFCVDVNRFPCLPEKQKEAIEKVKTLLGGIMKKPEQKFINKKSPDIVIQKWDMEDSKNKASILFQNGKFHGCNFYAKDTALDFSSWMFLLKVAQKIKSLSRGTK